MYLKWSCKKVIGEAKKLAASGQAMNYSIVARTRRDLVAAAERHCGSWSAALRKAGIRVQPIRNYRKAWKWTRKGIVKVLKQRLRERQSMRINKLRKTYAGIYKGAIREFGSWREALDAVGLHKNSKL